MRIAEAELAVEDFSLVGLAVTVGVAEAVDVGNRVS